MMMRCNRPCDFTDAACVDDDWAIIDDDETVCDSDDGLTLVEEVLYNNECREIYAFHQELRKIFRGRAYEKYIHPIAYQK